MGLKEIRCPIHGFVSLDDLEWDLINTKAFQRLRYIHQLAMTYLIYPGATHSRFEHMLGAMHLAGRVIDRLSRDYQEFLKTHFNWNPERNRRVLRLAALLHDIGHAPFSHGAEKDLFPEGYDHERMGVEIVLSDEIRSLIEEKHKAFGITANEIAYVMTGRSNLAKLPTPAPDLQFLCLLITGAFGVDRMDYLLRDSHHLGVAYGKFDLERLINTLGVIQLEGHSGPQLGVEEGGLYAAESLLLARYYMHVQVYFHDVRRIYDRHLVNYLASKYKSFPVTDLRKYIELTEPQILADIQHDALASKGSKTGAAARIIYERQHYRSLELAFSRTKFFDDKVIPAIEEKFTDLRPLSDHEDKVICDKPPTSIYKQSQIDKLFVFQKDSTIQRSRTIFDESEFLFWARPISICRIYLARNQKELKEKLLPICESLKRDEEKEIKRERLKLAAAWRKS